MEIDKGKLAVICGILGLLAVLIYQLLYASILGVLILLLLAILAISLGYSARKQGNKTYGTLGIILGVLVIILQMAINAYVYYYVWT